MATLISTNVTGTLDILNSTSNTRLLRLSHPSSPSDAAGFLSFNSDGTTNNMVVTLGVQYSSNYYNVINIKRDTRNVGIGIASPAATLHVKEIDTDEDAIIKISPNNGSYDPVLQFTPQDGTLDNEGFEIWYDNNVGDAHIHTIYNNDAAAIRFHTRTGASKSTSNERLTIAGDGNVGIGTTVPSKKLDVNGDVKIAGDTLNAGFLQVYGSNFNVGNNNYGVFLGTYSGGTSISPGEVILSTQGKSGWAVGDGLGRIRFFLGDSSGVGARDVAKIEAVNEFNGGTTTSGALAFYTSPYNSQVSERVRIAGDGNVGIGTTDPQTKLHLNGGSTSLPIIRLQRNDTSVVPDDLIGGIENYSNDADGSFISSYIKGYATETYGRQGYLTFGTAGTNSTDASEKMRIQADGNVGISSTDPQRTLDVSASGQITFGDQVSSATSDNKQGIYWHNSDSYGIFRTSGSWAAPDYQQLILKWATGIILNPGGGTYGKSHVGVVGGVSIGDSYFTSEYDNGLIVQGSVGIGTTSPGNYKLKVVGETHSTHFITGFDWTAKTGGLHIGNDGLTTGAISFYNGSNSSANIYRDSNILYVGARLGVNTRGLAIIADGNVGIGTAIPVTELHTYVETTGARNAPIDVLTLETEHTSSVEYTGFGQGIVFRGSTYNQNSQRTLGRILHQINDDSGNTTRGTSMSFQTSDNGSNANAPTTKVTIDYKGDVGIGTPTPANALTVAGDIGYTGYLGQGSIYGNAANASYARVQLYDPATGYTTFNNISYGYYFQTANSTKVTILNNGDVGIGTNNPKSILEIAANNPVINFKDTSAGTDLSYRYIQNVDGKMLFAKANDAYNSFTTHMAITTDGSVGIGTGTPSTKLEVVGETKSTNYRFSGPSDGGAVPAYSNSSYATVKYNEAQRATELVSSSDNAIGMAFPAFRVNESAGEQWKLWVQYKASASSSAGFYARIYEYSAELPDGKIAVSNSASNPVVQEDTSGRTDWKSNVAISTTWVTSTYTYTPNSNAKWASIVLLNWTGMGYNSLYARVGKERFFGTSSVITGSGTVNKLPLWDGTSSLTDSIITQSSTNYVTVFGGVRVSGNHTDTGSQLNLWCDSSGHGKLAVFDMQFLTGSNSARNNTALFLKNDGNVGISTSSPSAKLHVHSTTGILHTGDNFYSWVLKYLSNQTSSSGTVNYYLIAAKTQANVRLDGVLKGTRSSGVSASSSGGTRILFNTNSVALAIGGLESWGTDNPTYGHPIFTIVELTYNSVAYYALRISPSSSWVASFNHTQFEGIANNVLFTNVGAGDVSNILGFSGSESVFSYQHGNLGIGTGSPDAKLHIKAPANSVPAEIRLEHNDGGTQTAKIVFDQSGQNKLVLSTQYQSSSDGNLIQFAPADNIAMTIRGGTGTSDGFVGIGTTDPAQLLHVNGLTQLGAAGKTEGGAVLNYASFGETKSSASTILGNAIVPGTANSTVQRSKSDAGNFVRLKYNTGICFHTNITNTINTDIAETTNERVRIDLTGNLLISDGLVGAPSLSFINDTNTGMWRPGSDQLRLVTGGTNAIIIDSSQNVCIGTASPGAKLHVIEADTGEAFRIDGASSGFAMIVEGGTSYKTRMRGGVTIGSGYVASTPPANGLVVEGSVGIGITPAQKLHVSGNSLVTGYTYIGDANRYFTTGGGGVKLQTAYGYIQFGPDNTSWAHIHTDRGSFYFNKSITVDQGLVQSYNENLSLNASSTTSADIIFKSGGTEYMRMTSAGNVGIGTPSPSAKLQVKAAISTVYANVVPSISNSIIAISNTQTSETANDQAQIQFGVNGGTYNRVGSIGLIAESASNRKAALVFATDDAGTRAEKMRITGDGNVGIGTTNPSSKLEVAGNTILGDALTDTAIVHGHLGIGNDDYPKIAYPGQNALWSGSGSTTGQIVIDLPGTLANYDMMYMEIDIYEYSTKGATKLIIGGHNWNSGGNSNTSSLKWRNVNVQVLGALDKPIYFGGRNDGSNERRCIAIGEINSTWSYATVQVQKVHGAEFYSTSIDWVGDWNIDQTTSGTYFTKNPTTNFNSGTTLETNGKIYSPTEGQFGNAVAKNNSGVATFGSNSTATTIKINLDASASRNDLVIEGSTGNVGIGTVSPGAQLDVRGAAGYLKFDTSGADGTIKSDYNLKLYADDTGDNSSGYQNIQFFTAGANERMRIQHDGNVGIGTVTPSQKLHVVGKALITDDVQLTGSNPRIDFNTNGSSSLRFYDTTNAAERMRINTSGNLGINTTSPTSKLQVVGSTSGDSVLKIDGTNGTLFEVVDDLSDSLMSVNDAAGLPVFEVFADNHIVAGRYNQNDFYLDTNGYVGIGTTNPSSRLHIVSDTANGSIFEIDNQAGNQVLRVDQASTQTALTVSDQNAADKIVLNASSLLGGSIFLNDTSANIYLSIMPATGTVFNESGSAVDFRIEGDTDANLFFVDASTDRIGIGTNTNINTKLLVEGDATVNGDLSAGGSAAANRTLTLNSVAQAGRPAAKINNPNLDTATASDGRTFHGWLPIDLDGTVKYIPVYN